jgi:hypothetical protein
VKSLRLPDGSEAQAAPIAAAADFNPAERTAREKAFLEDWIKHLP